MQMKILKKMFLHARENYQTYQNQVYIMIKDIIV